MPNISIERPDSNALRTLGVEEWPVWSKEVSEFDWWYDTDETCYILSGAANIITDEGEKVSIGNGDLVVFPKGLKCRWRITKNIKKHYRMG